MTQHKLSIPVEKYMENFHSASREKTCSTLKDLHGLFRALLSEASFSLLILHTLSAGWSPVIPITSMTMITLLSTML